MDTLLIIALAAVVVSNFIILYNAYMMWQEWVDNK